MLDVNVNVNVIRGGSQKSKLRVLFSYYTAGIVCQIPFLLSALNKYIHRQNLNYFAKNNLNTF